MNSAGTSIKVAAMATLPVVDAPFCGSTCVVVAVAVFVLVVGYVVVLVTPAVLARSLVWASVEVLSKIAETIAAVSDGIAGYVFALVPAPTPADCVLEAVRIARSEVASAGGVRRLESVAPIAENDALAPAASVALAV
jgi:hypothetical protein